MEKGGKEGNLEGYPSRSAFPHLEKLLGIEGKYIGCCLMYNKLESICTKVNGSGKGEEIEDKGIIKEDGATFSKRAVEAKIMRGKELDDKIF